MCDLEANILENLKCVKCHLLLSVSPILLLQNGSSVCGRCDLTEGEMQSSLRDKPYEALSKSVRFPCQYKDCIERTTFDKVKLHEDSCMYGELICPRSQAEPKCEWKGIRGDLLNHFKEKHAQLIVANLHSCKLHETTHLLLLAYGFVFLIELIWDEVSDILCHYVQLIGDNKMAEEFRYCFEIKDEENSLKKSSSVKPAKNSIDMSEMNEITHLLDVFERLENTSCCIRIISKKALCSFCRNTIPSVDIYPTLTGICCKTCKIMHTTSEEIIQQYPCPNNGCSFITTEEFSLRKHYRWLCQHKNYVCNLCNVACNNISLMDHYKTSEKHEVIILNTDFFGVICFTQFDTTTTVWSRNTFFEFFNVMFRVYYHLSQNILSLHIASSVLPPDTKKFLFTLEIVDKTQAQYCDALYVKVYDITNLPKSNNEGTYDWRIVVPFSETCIKSFDIKKHIFKLNVKKV